MNSTESIKVTRLNIWTLAHAFENSQRISGRVSSVEAQHLRRCLKAGLIRVEGNELVLTEAGQLSIAK